MKNYHTIAFDLDGTLTDSSPGLTLSFRYAMRKLGIPDESRESLKRFIGPPLREEFQREYGISAEESNKALALFREYFSVYGWWDNKLYDGAAELLSDLKKSGKRIILASSKPEVFAVQILKLFGIYDYFDFIGAATLDKKRATKIEVLEYALEACGAKADGLDGVILIGDTKFDVEGANSVGIDSLAVLYGFGNEEEILKESPTYIAKTVDEIRNYI